MNAEDYLALMVNGYEEALVWSEGAEDGDYDYTLPDTIEMDCAGFLADHYDTLTTVKPWAIDPTLAGHDFVLTRNGHGVGFWDAGANEAGRLLTEGAKAYGTDYLTAIYSNEEDTQ